VQRTTFQSNPKSLEDLLKEVRSCKIQLPDFQRSWVWDDDRIKSLIASVSLNYPIGVVMMMQTGDDQVKFKARPLEGVTDVPTTPESLVLDGQQRLTSLFQALFQNGPVLTRDTKNKAIKRRYYIDIRRALDTAAEREDAIVSIDADRKVKNFRGEILADYSDRNLECLAEVFPVPLLFDTVELMKWQMAYLTCEPDNQEARMARWTQFTEEVVQRFQGYQVPVITMLKGTPKDAVCQVFEKVNTGGVPLTVFELLTATYAAEGFELRKDWEQRRSVIWSKSVLKGVENTDFLMAASLLATREAGRTVSCKRKDILSMSLDDYQCGAQLAVKGFERAARFLVGHGVYAAHDVPYKTQVVPLAAILAILGEKWEGDAIRTKLGRWYWCGVFGEMYGSTVETRFARDVGEVVDWIAGGLEPSTIQEAQFFESRLLRLRTRNSAAYKGVYNLLIKEGGLDFRTGESIQVGTYFDQRYDVHHVFPEDWCRGKGIPNGIYNAIANKTVISARTNRSIGGAAPSVYLARLQKAQSMSDARMDEIVSTHLIDPSDLRADDFNNFIEERRKALATRIESAMGKPIQRDVSNEARQEAVEDVENDVEVDIEA